MVYILIQFQAWGSPSTREKLVCSHQFPLLATIKRYGIVGGRSTPPPPPPIYFPGKSGRDKTRWPKTEIGNEISYRYLRSTRAWWGNRSRLEPSLAELPFQMPTRDTSREDLVDSPLHRQRKTASEEKFPQVEEIYERNQCKKGYRIDNGRGWQRERSRGG